MTWPNQALDRMRGSAVTRVEKSSVPGALPLIGQLQRRRRPSSSSSFDGSASSHANNKNMKTFLSSRLLVTFLLLTIGCSSPRKGRDGSHQEAFRHQLSESILVKEYGYRIKEVRFSKDRQKALVTFSHPDWKPTSGPIYINSTIRPDIEVIFGVDDFGRYLGRAHQPFYTPGRSGGETPSHDLVVDLYKR